MVRFDPMNPDHAKFKKNAEPKIQKNVTDISPDKIPKVVCGKGEDRTENVLVSKEKFYTVAETLKDSLRKQDEGNAFSFRKLFDVSDGGLSHDFFVTQSHAYCTLPLTCNHSLSFYG
jgi:hypothetical protein